MWIRKVMWLFLFCLFVFLFMIMAVTACQAEEQALKEAGADTIAYLTSVETEKHIAADKAEQAEDAAVEEKTEPIIKLYYDVPLDYELQDYIIHLCEEHHIDPAVVIAMIECESGYNAWAVGDDGDSVGLMQIQSRWHQARMDKLGCTNLFDPMQNVKVGIDYLAEMLDWYDGDIAKALTAYNRGSYSGYISEYATSVLAKAEVIRNA